jgi:hypothetical protein
VPDVPPKSLKLDLKPTTLNFTGASETKKTTYHLEIEFYGEIDVANSKTHHTPANIQMILRKKELKTEYWPRLLKSDKKVHYLRTDFDKVCSTTHPAFPPVPSEFSSLRSKSNMTLTPLQWVDEDEQNEAPEDDYLNQFGGGMGEDGGFGGIDFSKLGGGAGAGGDMPGMEGMGAEGAEDDDEEEDSDEDMPELEGDDDDKGKGKEKA